MAISTTINSLLADKVFMIYSNAESKMLDKVSKRIAKGITTEGWNEKKLKEMSCVQLENNDKVLFINFDESLDTEKDRHNFSCELNSILNKVESTNISLVFTNKKVIFSKFNSEQLLGLGLKKVQAVRKVFIE